MQQFMNPQYLNPYPQYRPAYQQYQQYQPTVQQQPQVGGKVVDSIDVVKATDIPMDGNLYYFPKADGTEIYTKNWNTDGTTRILTYKPCLEEGTDNLSSRQEQSQNDAITALTARFEERFDKLEKLISKGPAVKAKKESDPE